jgi:hypothetical protein
VSIVFEQSWAWAKVNGLKPNLTFFLLLFFQKYPLACYFLLFFFAFSLLVAPPVPFFISASHLSLSDFFSSISSYLSFFLFVYSSERDREGMVAEMKAEREKARAGKPAGLNG